jgi:hypothetical protein
MLLALAACHADDLDGQPFSAVTPTPDSAEATFSAPAGWGTCASLRALSVPPGDDYERYSSELQDDRWGSVLTASTAVEVDEDWSSVSSLVRTAADDTTWTAHLEGQGSPSMGAVAWTEEGGVLFGAAWREPATFTSGTGEELSLEHTGDTADSLIGVLGPDGRLLELTTYVGVTVSVRAVLPGGDRVLTGTIAEEVTLGSGDGQRSVLFPEGVDVLSFFARVRADGSVAWIQAVWGTESVGIGRVVHEAESDALTVALWVDGAGVAVLGAGQPGEVHIEPAGSVALVARYSGDGVLQWVAQAGGTGASAQQLIALPGGEVLAGGHYNGTVTFGRDEPNEISFVTDSNGDGWMARFAADGQLRWATVAHSPGCCNGAWMGTLRTAGDEILWLSTFYQQVEFGVGEPGRLGFSSPENRAGFLARFDLQDGTFRCAVIVRAVDRGEDFGIVWPTSLVPRPDSGWDVLGYAQGTVTFGEGAGVQVIDTVHEDPFRMTVDLLPEP